MDCLWWQVLKKEEAQHNGTSKVSVSFSKYKVIPEASVWDEEEEEGYFLMDDRKRDIDW